MIKLCYMENLKPGMLLGQTIIDSNGRKLILKDRALTDFTIEKLKNMGFNYLYIEDEVNDVLLNDDVISEELKQKMTEDLKNLLIRNTVQNAKQIVDLVCDNCSNVFDKYDIRNRDNYTYRHSISVAEYVTAIGVKLGLKKTDLINLASAALLHDIGKSCIDSKTMEMLEISKKDMSYQEKFHPAYAASMLKDIPEVSSTARVAILFHHKNVDGTGFPEKKSAPNHPFYKIIRVADTYDKLISPKEGERLSPNMALEYLYANCGSLFSKEITNLFRESVPIYPRGVEVTLSNGITGIVINNTTNRMRPIVEINVDGIKKQLDLRKQLNITIVDVKITDISNDNDKGYLSNK